MKSKAFCLAACLAVGLSGSCWAQDLKAQQKFTDTEIGFEILGPYSNLTLTVTGPNGINAQSPLQVRLAVDRSAQDRRRR